MQKLRISLVKMHAINVHIQHLLDRNTRELSNGVMVGQEAEVAADEYLGKSKQHLSIIAEL